ncbi:putative conserved protein, contains NRDE domain [Fodinibius salinus]|uniref:Putative conserved protein, contains NRDE domain n=1 Tax=Fodinibius salinus TaxID=860790 RepID=A0A5D3YFC0_9BACT|nr:NRDE family protein [Fodinibius salinus]TYP92177.1 putative conserved protein, contains NRDE domain [Fodinibius salinus]
MCLIAFAYKQHPTYNLIFAANRDENYNRPTCAAQFWDDYPTLLAGKDLKAGGTWMGITKQGRFAALTNYRDPSIQKENPPSRGELALDFLKTSDTPMNYLRNIHSKANQYMGFNLLAGTIDQIGYYSNQQDNAHQLNSGLYGLSNHLLDTSWPKVNRAKENLRYLIKNKQISEQALFDLLADDQQAPDDKLPDTGISKEVEKQVSPVFIKSDNYGTRCSTVLLIDKDGVVTFTERRFQPGTLKVEDENQYRFSIDPNPAM